MMTELTEHPTVMESYFSLGQREDAEGLVWVGLSFELGYCFGILLLLWWWLGLSVVFGLGFVFFS